MPLVVGTGLVMQKLEARKSARARLAQLEATEHAERAVKDKLTEQDLAAERAARAVKESLAIAAADQLLKLEVIRIEGNSKMGAQKRESMEAWQAAAKASGDPEHAAKARQAEKIYNDHLAAEKLADERVRLFVESERLKLLRLPPASPDHATPPP